MYLDDLRSLHEQLDLSLRTTFRLFKKHFFQELFSFNIACIRYCYLVLRLPAKLDLAVWTSAN